MPFNKVSTFEKSFPAVKNLPTDQKQKALEIFNALLRDDPDMDEGRAIAIAISRTKKQEKSAEIRFNTLNNLEIQGEEVSSDIEVLRVGTLQDRKLQITDEMLDDFVKNFNENVYGTELQVNLGHDDDGEAAGWIKNLYRQGKSLFAKIAWTDLGEEKIKKRRYKFISAEFSEKYPHYKTGNKEKNVFVGLALTNVPALKAQEPLLLSDEILLKLRKIIMFQKYATLLNEREWVSKEEKETLKTMLQELSEEDAEEVKEVVEEVEAKPEQSEAEESEEDEEEEDEEKEGEEEEGGEEENKEENKEELRHKLTNHETKIKKLTQQNQELARKIELKELNETFENRLSVSYENEIGFLADSKEDVINFLSDLSQEQRNTFMNLLSQVRMGDFTRKGSTQALDVSEDALTKLADKLLDEGKAKDIEEAQKMATKQLN